MATQLHQVVRFTAVAAGATVSLPHTINVNGAACVPDVAQPGSAVGTFTIDTVTDSLVTVTNAGAAPANFDVLLTLWHTLGRSLGASAVTGGVVPGLVVRPFITGGGGGGSGGGAQGAAGVQGPTGPVVFSVAEQGEDGDMGPPGVAGPQGAPGAPGSTGSTGGTGAQGPTGPAVFLVAEQGEDGDMGPPGVRGAQGLTGTPGAQGPMGPAVFWVAEQGEDGDMGPPGPSSVYNPVTGRYGVVGELIQVGDSAAVGSTYASGLPFVPLRQGQADWVRMQFVSSHAGSIEIAVVYAMSAANSGNVSLRLDSLNVSLGGDPGAALATGTPTTITPGNDTVLRQVTSTSVPGFLLVVTRGALLDCTITRPLAGDTHTGDLRVLGVVIRVVS